MDIATSRLGFVRKAYSLKHPPEVVDFLVSYLRASSLRQYNSVWKAFQRFCIAQRDLRIDLNLVLRFLVFVFQKRGYQVGTIASFKSALKEPLRIGFSLDLGDPLFKSLLKSMWLKRPGLPVVEPKWDLDIVLGYLASGHLTSGVSQFHLAIKCVFLLGIALGYRIS